MRIQDPKPIEIAKKVRKILEQNLSIVQQESIWQTALGKYIERYPKEIPPVMDRVRKNPNEIINFLNDRKFREEAGINYDTDTYGITIRTAIALSYLDKLNRQARN